MASESNLPNVCGLWKQQSKDGTTYLSGVLGNVKIMVFQNRNKTSNRAPDYTLCLAPRAEKKQANSNEPPPPEDDVPF
jgi:hypothetical protein